MRNETIKKIEGYNKEEKITLTIPIYLWRELKSLFESCWACGKKINLDEHHLTPKKKGGNRTIPLCDKHHKLIEGIKLAIDICTHERKLSVTQFKKMLRNMENLKEFEKENFK